MSGLSKNFKRFLHQSLPAWAFDRLRNLHRKRLRNSGLLTEVYVSGWPLARKVNGGRIFQCRPNGIDEITFDQVFRQQEYNLGHLSHKELLLARYASFVRPALILDLGANIGASSVFFAESFPDAAIIAVEPDVANFALLEENTKAYSRVKCVHGGAAAEDGWMQILNPEGDANSFRTSKVGANDGSIRAYGLQALLELVDAEPFFLKVDIEGGEENLFSSHWEIIDRFPIVAVEIHDWLYPGQGTSRNFMKWHARADRDLLIHGEMLYSLER